MNKRLVILTAIGLGSAAILSKFAGWKPVDLVGSLSDAPQNGSYSKRQLSQVTTIVVHHSAVLSAYAGGGANPQGYNTFHQTSPLYKYPRIAYHIVIQPDGNAYLCNYLDTISYHVGTLNPSAIGVCITGNFDQEPFTPAMQASLEKTLLWIQSQVGRKLKIHGHYRYSNKTCPGMNVRTVLPSIINRVGGLV